MPSDRVKTTCRNGNEYSHCSIRCRLESSLSYSVPATTKRFAATSDDRRLFADCAFDRYSGTGRAEAGPADDRLGSTAPSVPQRVCLENSKTVDMS